MTAKPLTLAAIVSTHVPPNHEPALPAIGDGRPVTTLEALIIARNIRERIVGTLPPALRAPEPIDASLNTAEVMAAHAGSMSVRAASPPSASPRSLDVHMAGMWIEIPIPPNAKRLVVEDTVGDRLAELRDKIEREEDAKRITAQAKEGISLFMPLAVDAIASAHNALKKAGVPVRDVDPTFVAALAVMLMERGGGRFR